MPMIADGDDGCHRVQILETQKICDSVNSPRVFAHNDLLSGNILVMQGHPDDLSKSMQFIDYEYSACGFRSEKRRLHGIFRIRTSCNNLLVYSAGVTISATILTNMLALNVITLGIPARRRKVYFFSTTSGGLTRRPLQAAEWEGGRCNGNFCGWRRRPTCSPWPRISTGVCGH